LSFKLYEYGKLMRPSALCPWNDFLNREFNRAHKTRFAGEIDFQQASFGLHLFLSSAPRQTFLSFVLPLTSKRPHVKRVRPSRGVVF
jgi:hypothetical protein